MIIKALYKLAFLSLVSLFTGNNLSAQDTLYLLSGEIMEVNLKAISDYKVSYEFPHRKGIKYRDRDLRTIFSYKKNGADEIIVYKHDPDKGNIYELKEMQYFILGQRDALKSYDGSFIYFLSIVNGFASGGLLSKEEMVAAATFPILLSSFSLAIPIKEKNNSGQDGSMEKHLYKKGYKRIAKSKKFFNSLKYGTVSMLISFGLFELIDR